MKVLTGKTLTVVLLASCKKYDHGPAFSLRSKNERVASGGKIDYANDYKNGVNVTTDYTGETRELTKGGDFFKRDNDTIDKTGTWGFVSNKEQITINFSLSTHTYSILRLKENELWLKDIEEELHLIPAN